MTLEKQLCRFHYLQQEPGYLLPHFQSLGWNRAKHLLRCSFIINGLTWEWYRLSLLTLGKKVNTHFTKMSIILLREKPEWDEWRKRNEDASMQGGRGSLKCLMRVKNVHHVPYSADLNSAEHLWEILKWRVKKHTPPLSSKEPNERISSGWMVEIHIKEHWSCSGGSRSPNSF